MATKLWNSTSSTDWGTAGNWSPSGVPATGDTVILANSSVNIDTTLNQSAVTLAALYIYQSYTGAIGTSAGVALQVGATLCRIGDPANSATTPGGAGRIILDFGSVQTTCIIVNTSSASTDAAFAPVSLKGTHASNKLIVYGGRVESANRLPTDAATWAEVDVQAQAGVSAPMVYLASGCTLTALNQSAGTLTINSAATTIVQSAGTLTTQGSGAITTVTAGGTANLNSTGTITTANAIGGGTANFSGDSQAKTVTTLKAYAGCTIKLDNGVKNSITLTNPLALQNCRLSDITLVTWINNTVALA